MYLDYFSFLLLFLVTVFSIYIVVVKRDYVKKHRNIILFVFIGVLLYSQYSRYFARLFTINASYSIRDLPLGYCRLSAIMITIYVFTKNKYIGQFLYFQAGFGFFSLLFPGGNIFILTQNHRSLGYVFDHYMIAMMTVFLIYIEGIRPSRKGLYFMMAYAFIVPFSLLPYALSSGQNTFYILDGVFIKMVFGSNQVVISIIYFIGVNLYLICMYYLGKAMSKHSETPQKESVFKPLWPWISLAVFAIAGFTVGSFFIRTIPDEVIELTDTYIEEPVRVLDDFANIYEGQIDGETYFFIHLLEKYEEVEALDYNGDYLLVSEAKDLFYFKQADADGKVIIILYKNRGEDNEKVRTYNFNN